MMRVTGNDFVMPLRCVVSTYKRVNNYVNNAGYHLKLSPYKVIAFRSAKAKTIASSQTPNVIGCCLLRSHFMGIKIMRDFPPCVGEQKNPSLSDVSLPTNFNVHVPSK